MELWKCGNHVALEFFLSGVHHKKIEKKSLFISIPSKYFSQIKNIEFLNSYRLIFTSNNQNTEQLGTLMTV